MWYLLPERLGVIGQPQGAVIKYNAGQTAKGSGSMGPEPSFTKQDTARMSHLPRAYFQTPLWLREDMH